GPPGAAARGAAMVILAGGGALGGVVGIGAGALIIPVLIYVLGVPVRTAGGTGLVLAVVLSALALAGKAATGQVAWDLAAAGAGGGLFGAMVGARLSGLAEPALLRRLLAALVGLLAVRVWLDLLLG
ncbi:MAG TPA: TSUP family transporter, partial [Candidatus Dormibacteraeota bacterium]|nr:TSUP family transporter [Candidatus Dormibacteraeota bacterium]